MRLLHKAGREGRNRRRRGGGREEREKSGRNETFRSHRKFLAHPCVSVVAGVYCCCCCAGRLGTPPPASHIASWEEVMPGAFYVKEHEFFQTTVEDEVRLAYMGAFVSY